MYVKRKQHAVEPRYFKNLYRTNYFFISVDKKSAFDMQVYEL